MVAKATQKVTAGVDAKADSVLVLHEQTIYFFNIHQVHNESEEEYLVRFFAKHKSLEMMGGEHIFVSPLILGSSIEGASQEAKVIQKEKFLTMCFFIRADERRYGELHEDLKKGFFSRLG